MGGGLLQGSGIAGQIAGFLLEGLTSIAGRSAVHASLFYDIPIKYYENAIELI
jgi:hypothetical protein